MAIIWAGNYVLPIFVHSYHPDPSLNGVFSGLITTALGLSVGKSGRSDDREPADDRARRPPARRPPPPRRPRRRTR